jgi:hypothetical protein
MYISDIEKTLPNGFRGSMLRKITVKNRAYELKLFLDINLSEPGNEQSVTKRGIIIVKELVYFIVNDSETDILSNMAQGINISESGTVESLKADLYIPGPFVEEAFRHYFFMPDFGEYIFVSGKDCQFELEE